MVLNSELDYLQDFIGKINTTHTVNTIETIRNINLIADTQGVLIFTGEIVGTGSYSLRKRYPIQYKDATEGALNTAMYNLTEGIRKLNAREVITSYTRPNSLIGINFISSGTEYFNIKAGVWYGNNITIEAEWLIT